MKKYLTLTIAIAFVLGSSTLATAQKSSMKEHKTAMTSGTVNIVNINELIIEGYSGSDVVVSTMVEKTEGDDRAAGLKLLNSLGLDDNTGFGISVSKDGDNLNIRQISKTCSCDKITVKVPSGVNVSVTHDNYNADLLQVKNISSELEITTNYHDVHLEDVTGPMAVKTVYGSIEAKFDKVSQAGSVSLYSVYELVDVTIPSSSGMNVTLSAPSGNVYSNADVSITKSENNSHGSCNSGSTIMGTINGGGVEFSVKSAYEDVYFRKAE
ncbi:MAG: hypothetical protein AAGA77_17235 [Bacteroidota bacterium]